MVIFVSGLCKKTEILLKFMHKLLTNHNLTASVADHQDKTDSRMTDLSFYSKEKLY